MQFFFAESGLRSNFYFVRSLQDILSDLHDYHSQQQQWVRLQERLTWEQAPFEVQFAGYTSDKLSTIMANRGQRCVQKKSDGSEPVISCDFTDNNKANNLQVGAGAFETGTELLLHGCRST